MIDFADFPEKSYFPGKYPDMIPSLTTFGELLLRLHSSGDSRFLQTSGYTPFYAGAEANLSVLLARLGIPAQYITRVPGHDLSLAGIAQLRGQGVDVSNVLYGGQKLGIYFSETGNHIRPVQVIYDRAGSAFSELKPGMIHWDDVLDGQTHFHWTGVSPAVSASAAEVCAEAINAARNKGINVSADFNYRSRLWQYGKHPREVMPALLAQCHIAVADLDACHVYFGLETDASRSWEQQFETAAHALKDQFMPDLQALAMSFRVQEGGQLMYTAALMTAGKAFFSHLKVALPQVRESIGTGDAFAGGLLYATMMGFSPQDTIDFATACGIIKQSIPGDWPLFSKEEVQAMMSRGINTRISR